MIKSNEHSISINEYEMSVVLNKDFMLTKKKIIEKVYVLFGKIASEYAVMFRQFFPAMEGGFPKISKGENYLGLPYVMLDFPRLFGKEDVFAIRCFFWWGNFFSITLHLAGKYKHEYEAALIKAISENEMNDWYISNGENPWLHHFEEDNYTQVKVAAAHTFAGRQFVKLAKKIPLVKWDDADTFFIEAFEKLMQKLSCQAPMR